MNEILQLIFSDRPLAITDEGYRYLLALATFDPMFAASKEPSSPAQSQDDTLSRQALQPAIPYITKAHSAFIPLAKAAASEGITLTDDYTAEALPDNSVAYHPVIGTIRSDSSWMFSSKRLERNLIDAENNPSITAHLLHVNSPGGEAYYLDQLGRTLSSLSKPIVATCEQACSAAYHIACHADMILATTQFDYFGCIGTMISFYDYGAYLVKTGLTHIVAKADQSDLKNKTAEDLLAGKPEGYIAKVLNPMNDAFISEVRSCRQAIAKLPDDSPVLRGETFFPDEAMSLGLVDDRKTFNEAVSIASDLGRKWSNAARLQSDVIGALS